MPAVHSKSFATGAEIAGIDPGNGAGDRDSDGGEKLMNSRVFLVLMIVALMVRPYGIFGKRIIERV